MECDFPIINQAKINKKQRDFTILNHLLINISLNSENRGNIRDKNSV